LKTNNLSALFSSATQKNVHTRVHKANVLLKTFLKKKKNLLAKKKNKRSYKADEYLTKIKEQKPD